jgi:hypothetical protein
LPSRLEKGFKMLIYYRINYSHLALLALAVSLTLDFLIGGARALTKGNTAAAGDVDVGGRC